MWKIFEARWVLKNESWLVSLQKNGILRIKSATWGKRNISIYTILCFLEYNLIFHAINVAEISIVINGKSNLLSKGIHSLKNKITYEMKQSTTWVFLIQYLELILNIPFSCLLFVTVLYWVMQIIFRNPYLHLLVYNQDFARIDKTKQNICSCSNKLYENRVE